MNTETPPPPSEPAAIPPLVPQPPGIQGPVTLMNVVEHLLKHPARLLQECKSGQLRVPARLLASTLVSFGVFGLLLGTFSGGVQLWAVPLKMTLGICMAVLICLPSLYIFSALDGVDARLGQVATVLLSAVALAGLLLLGFSPVLWVFSTSISSLAFMGFLAFIFWVIGLYFGSRLLLQSAAGQGLKSNGYLKTWLVIFVIVTLQMSTSLRPLIGQADTLLPTQKKFFIQHWIDQLDPASL